MKFPVSQARGSYARSDRRVSGLAFASPCAQLLLNASIFIFESSSQRDTMVNYGGGMLQCD